MVKFLLQGRRDLANSHEVLQGRPKNLSLTTVSRSPVSVFHRTARVILKVGYFWCLKPALNTLGHMYVYIWCTSAGAWAPAQNIVGFRHWLLPKTQVLFRFQEQGWNLVPRHRHCARILVWVLRKKVCSHIVPSEYRTLVTCPFAVNWELLSHSVVIGKQL